MRTRTISTKKGSRTSNLYTYAATWTRRGFLPWEAKQLQTISKDGREAPYLQEMIARRMELYQNAKDNKISKRGYRRLVSEEYAKWGINPRALQERDARGRFLPYADKAFWALFNAYKDDKSTWWRNPDWEYPEKYKKTAITQDFQQPKGARAKQKAHKLDDLLGKQMVAKRQGDRKEYDKLEREIRGIQGR